MHVHHVAAATLALALAGCGSRADEPRPVVSFTSPVSAVHTARDSVPLQVHVSPGSEQVELLRNGEPFAVLAPPWQYTFFTAFEAEGRYEFVARARSGDGWAQSQPLEVWIDRTAPAIAVRSPDAGSQWATRLDPITFALSEPVDAASVAAAVRLSSRATGEVASIVALGADRRTVTVTPGAPFAAEDDVTLTVDGVRDLAGHALAAATWTFGVQSTWQLLGRGEVPGGGLTAAGAPAIAVAPDFTLAVATADGVRRFDGDAFTAPTPGATAERIAGPAGGGGELWGLGAGYSPASGSYEVRGLRWSGGTWKRDVPAIPTPFYPSSTALAVIDGALLAAWAEHEFPEGRALPTRASLVLWRWNGVDWSRIGGPVTRSDGNAIHSTQLAYGPAGTFVAWVEAEEQRVARLDGDTLTPLPAPPLYRIAIAVGTTGELFAAGNSAPTQALQVHRFENGGWAQVGGDVAAGAVSGRAAMAIDRVGRITVAWTSGATLRAKRWQADGWADGGTLNAGATRAVWGRPTVALDAEGRPVVAWMEDVSRDKVAPLVSPLYVKRLLE